MSKELEASGKQLRAWGDSVTEAVVRYLEALSEGEVAPSDLKVRIVKKAVEEPLPRASQGWDKAWQDTLSRVLPHSVRVGHPHFLAWIRTSPLAAAVFAESLAAALNQSVAVWDGAPAAAEVERLVIRWLVELSGFHEDGDGLLTSGGSMANFTGLAAARSAAFPGVREQGVKSGPQLKVYLTSQAHYSVIKAVEMLGLGRRCIRKVPVDRNLRMDPEALAGYLQADQRAGFKPMAVVATMGTTSTGSCDDLEALADVCRQQAVWLHVDGAYGGLARQVPGKEYLAAGLARADSLVIDPHKNLFMPFEAGCLLVRDPADLRRAFAVRTDYLPNTSAEGDGDPDVPRHFRDYGPQLSRGFRALKMYLTLKTYGADAIMEELAREYRLASQLEEMIRRTDDFQLLAPVTLGVAAFRCLHPAAAGEDDLNSFNSRLVEEVQRRGRVFLSRVRVEEKVGFRACFVSHRTRKRHLAPVLEEIRAAARAFNGSGKKG